MASKREEERNEKIIRGLMKLPPNRHCINCNSIGPQYVCINFWTFVCMTCSGIHREFTHRVKSVSMSKFTSDEVEALQKGGNQRAREIYLKDWDLQRLRLPNSSDAEKVREFIKNVYVDKKFAGGKNSEKLPSDLQSLDINIEKETRRASSYHSFSQSPPYDFQYEERKNRRHGAALTRKPGSDRGLYERKISSFVHSPGPFSEHAYEERSANEGSSSRISDYSISSGGDQYRSSPQSPNSQKDSGYNSPTMDPTRGARYSVTHVKRDTCAVPHPQRTKSSGSIGSVDGHSLALKQAYSTSSPGFSPEFEQSDAVNQNKATDLPLFSSSSTSNSATIDLFTESVGGNSTSLAEPIDLFQFSAVEAVELTNLFPPALDSSATTTSFYASQTSASSSSNFFSEISQNLTDMKVNETLSQLPAQNRGWATFDLPPHASSVPDRDEIAMEEAHSVVEIQSSIALGSLPPFPNPWHESMLNMPAATNAGSSQNTAAAGFQETASGDGNPVPTFGYHETAAASYHHVLPPMSEGHSHVDCKPGNPFDIPYDSAFEANNVFLGMSSLAATLPSTQLPSSFFGGINESWFLPNTSDSCLGTASQGGLSYMSAQSPSASLQNVPINGPVTSLGGNPFA
ncbi:hypothetical protein Dimus_029987 [Dionaea muscipula]